MVTGRSRFRCRSVAFMVAAALIFAILGLAACGSSSTSSSATTDASATPGALNPLTGVAAPAEDASLAALVPKALRDKGYIAVGTDATYAPKEFVAADGHTLIGTDIDFAYALGDVLGIKMKFVQASFDSLIPSILNGKFDLGDSSAAPTPAREKVVTFVTTDYSGEGLLIRKADANKYSKLTDFSGQTVAVLRGSLEVQDAQAATAQLKAAGKPGITVQVYPDGNSAFLALNSGRAAAVFADTPSVSYQATQSKGAMVVVGPVYRAGLEGMFMTKTSGLDVPLVRAMNELIADGTYQKILQKWNEGSSALKTSVINPKSEQG
jgi:polar amino acid transport system substrate-binding protein